MYSAEVGRTAGGVVNIITKSGTNDFHGSAFEFNRNDRVRLAQLLRATGPSRSSTQNQFGGSLGGPMTQRPDVLLRRLRGLPPDAGRDERRRRVPTAKMRAGDFSELSVPIYDPIDDAARAVSGQQSFRRAGSIRSR